MSILLQTRKINADTSITSFDSYFKNSLKLTEFAAGQLTPEVLALK